MLSIPSAAHDLLMSLSVAFTDPTFRRVLVTVTILTVGDRTVAGMLRTMPSVATGDASTYHRVFSRASWSLWPLAEIRATVALSQIPPDEPVLVALYRPPSLDQSEGRRHKTAWDLARQSMAVLIHWFPANRAKKWCRFAGSSSATARARIETTTSTRPIHR